MRVNSKVEWGSSKSFVFYTCFLAFIFPFILPLPLSCLYFTTKHEISKLLHIYTNFSDQTL